MSPGQPLSRKTVADKQKSANLMQASKKETCQNRLEQIHFFQGSRLRSKKIKLSVGESNPAFARVLTDILTEIIIYIKDM